MTKKEIIRESPDIHTGISGHTYLFFGKKNGKWIAESEISARWEPSDIDDWDWFSRCNHDRNTMTLDEARNELEAAQYYNE